MDIAARPGASLLINREQARGRRLTKIRCTRRSGIVHSRQCGRTLKPFETGMLDSVPRLCRRRPDWSQACPSQACGHASGESPMLSCRASPRRRFITGHPRPPPISLPVNVSRPLPKFLHPGKQNHQHCDDQGIIGRPFVIRAGPTVPPAVRAFRPRRRAVS